MDANTRQALQYVLASSMMCVEYRNNDPEVDVPLTELYVRSNKVIEDFLNNVDRQEINAAMSQGTEPNPTVKELRDLGACVAIFYPDDLRGFEPRKLELALQQTGVEIISDLLTHQEAVKERKGLPFVMKGIVYSTEGHCRFHVRDLGAIRGGDDGEYDILFNDLENGKVRYSPTGDYTLEEAIAEAKLLEADNARPTYWDEYYQGDKK